MFRSLLICLLFSSVANAQSSHKYFIRFADKNNSTFSVNNPEDFLSARAIARREAHNIPISSNDIPVNTDYIDSLVVRGATVITRNKWFNGVTISCDSSILPSIGSLPFVVSSARVFRYSGSSVNKEIPDILPLVDKQILRTNNYDYGSSLNQIHLMNAESLHDDGFTGDGMLMAIIDDGFFSVDQLEAFDSLRSMNHIVATWDFVTNDSSVYEDDSHGMSVLSTIAGNVPGQLVGTAPHASFLLLRSEDVASENIIEEYNWAAAAEYADSAGADVISSSLGYTTFDNLSDSHVYADMDGDHCPSSIAADIAASKGMLVITSAGNSGTNSWHYLSAPSDGDSVLSVGAVDSYGHYADFSSAGPASDGAVKPNVASKGYAATLANSIGGISLGSGTSFACPILAGAATCLWQAYPKLTAMQIKKAIERSGNYFSAPNDSLGYGIPDFRLANYYLSTGNGTLPFKDEVLGIYPNPFSENLTIRFFAVKSQSVRIEMIDALGKIVCSKYENASAWNLNSFVITNENSLTIGIYFVRLSTADETFVNRVIKD